MNDRIKNSRQNNGKMHKMHAKMHCAYAMRIVWHSK